MPGRPREDSTAPARHRLTWLLIGAACAILLQWGANLLLDRTSIPDRMLTFLLVDDTPGSADAIVVLGAGVVGACLPNQSGLLRTLLAARLLREGRAPLMLFTGGSGRPCPVAQAMARFAREIGVPESRVHLETASRSTRENAERSAPLLRRLGARRLLLVTDRLHMRRAEGAFSAFGFDVERASVPVYRSYDSNTSMLRAGIVELAALGYYRARGWIDANDRVTTGGDDVDSQTTVARGEASNPSGPLVILGASYARGWALASVAGFAVVNRGVEGDRSIQMLERLEQDVLADRPRAVILWGFINDFFRAAPDDLDGAARRVPDHYRRMIAMLREHGVEPIVATEVTVRPPDTWRETLSSWIATLRGKETYQDRINRRILATNRSLVELARKERVLVLDFQAALGGNGGIRRRAFTQPDGSHITEDGYATLTAYVTPMLERHLAGERR
jgi:uncharacterized SAM-binding protein YcdF (DUF218 family)/lysophospholipase L1-like esterase